ncbi:ATP-binding protein [Vineibacter terrae]|uniref:ATP-binding protein n=1 Tax=Vineibacter terrae TaxID=2586908 RepID=UPI002E2F043B|nr:ATP-binding protein [Vineibacter terrae]HEX2889912.1 ATP-binding protein [Vineibacter terrae]
MPVADPSALLRNLCAEPHEREWLEFKVNYFKAEEIGEYACALANAAMLAGQPYGYLVFGVENESHKIVGTTVRLSSAKVGNEPLENWLARGLEPRLLVEFIEFEEQGCLISMMKIDPAYQRPVSFNRIEHIRVGSVTKLLREHPERARMLWAATSRVSFEQGIALGHVTAEVVAREFACSELLALVGKPSATLSQVIDTLLAQQLIVDNRQGRFDVTNLLALLAARDLSTHPSIRTKAPRVVVYEGTSKVVGKGRDVTGQLGYAISFKRLLRYVMENVPTRETMYLGERIVLFDYPEIAIREFLANALIHQDFTVTGSGPMIEIFSDRLQITNLGTPIVDIARFIDTPSRSRNDRLARMMRILGLCEERGSGIDRALVAIEGQTLPPPLFEEGEASTSVTMFLPKTFASMTKAERLRACYQHACLCHQARKPMSNGSLRIRLGLGERQYPQVSRLISEALDEGLIVEVAGDNRSVRYEPWWVRP